MRTILQILERAGGYRSDLYLRIENSPYMALVIEATPEPGPLGVPAISIAHYGEQNGDLMRDPEMCFELTNPLGTGWTMTAYYFRNDYMGVEQYSRTRDERTTFSIPTSCTSTSSSAECGIEISAHRASLKPSSAAANPPLSGRARSRPAHAFTLDNIKGEVTMTIEVQSEYRNLPLDSLTESPNNPRRSFDAAALNELAESIKTQGILAPLVVRPVDHHFEIVAGARRYRAAQLAGLETAPVRIVELTDAQALETSIVENLQRRDVHPLDEAQGFAAL